MALEDHICPYIPASNLLQAINDAPAHVVVLLVIAINQLDVELPLERRRVTALPFEPTFAGLDSTPLRLAKLMQASLDNHLLIRVAFESQLSASRCDETSGRRAFIAMYVDSKCLWLLSGYSIRLHVPFIHRQQTRREVCD